VGGNGCNGGQLQWGFQYALRNDGLTALNAYPYTGQGGQACDAAAADWKVVQINGVEWVDVQDEQALMDAVAKGVSVEGDWDEG
jgi:xylem cysteine proteinase